MPLNPLQQRGFPYGASMFQNMHKIKQRLFALRPLQNTGWKTIRSQQEDPPQTGSRVYAVVTMAMADTSTGQSAREPGFWLQVVRKLQVASGAAVAGPKTLHFLLGATSGVAFH